MRVAFHAGQLLQPVPGGIGRYEVALLRRLPELGVEPIAFAAGARPPKFAPAVPWIDLGWPHGSARYELWHRAQRPLVRLDADLVHAPSLAVPPVRGRPLVVTAHDIAFLRLPHVTTRRGVSFHRRGLELARRRAAIVVAPSNFTASELEREGFDRSRIEVVPFGVDPPAPRTDDEIDAALARVGITGPYVLTVGTIEPRKDVTTIVRAVGRLRHEHPELELVVAGPRGWGEVHELDRPFVQVIGPQPWAILDALYRRADAFCVASKYEGFGLPAVEALARGAPTVTTTGSALEEVVRDAGLLFAPGDVDGCSDALARVLEDPGVRSHLRDTGIARAREFTWPRSAEGHVRAYTRAVERGAP